jgi:hypothetical protein
MDERIDYDNLLEKIIKNSVDIGHNDPNYCIPYIPAGKHIIFKIEQKIKNRKEQIIRHGDIILSVQANKPFRILSNKHYITPWINSIKKHKIKIPVTGLQFCHLYIETESDKVIFEHILIGDKNRRLLIHRSYILNTYIDKFLVKCGYLYNITNYNIWNCKKSHLKKSEKYQKIYKSLFENNKLSPDIINLIIEQQYVIVDPGICTCLKA